MTAILKGTALVLIAAFLAVGTAQPTRAQSDLGSGDERTAQLHLTAGGDILAIPKIDKLLNMDYRRLLAWIGGLTLGNFVIEGYLSGLQVPYLGLVIGGLIGELWYSKHIFPFDGTI